MADNPLNQNKEKRLTNIVQSYIDKNFYLIGKLANYYDLPEDLNDMREEGYDIIKLNDIKIKKDDLEKIVSIERLVEMFLELDNDSKDEAKRKIDLACESIEYDLKKIKELQYFANAKKYPKFPLISPGVVHDDSYKKDFFDLPKNPKFPLGPDSLPEFPEE